MSPKFFPVLGKSDTLSIAGNKQGIWEFLEPQNQPGGWLISLSNKPTLFPNSVPIFWDCSAIRYSHLNFPQIRNSLITPLFCINQYLSLKAKSGDFITCPDHILLPNSNLEFRRQFNFNSAKQFLLLAKIHLPWCLPLATIHGLTIEEKVKNAVRLYELGYRMFAIGSLAINASQKQPNITAIQAIRATLPPSCYLHIFGLSSPDYVQAFTQIGINSFDGSSWLRQSFLGFFYEAKNNKLIKHRVPQILSRNLAIPLCHCRICETLRNFGIETRAMGNRVANLGRAIHNLGELIKIHQQIISNQMFS
ncbi:hypothetical protein NIES2119_30005 [[Phormidium ambiguum] IAM M-71]|uniref:tRNA-guanine(15) transglycosylase-like domain-containing protein n=1 Tax=[Phormidium ambiguum] IAM M-71 TaxID=454136 RepID=A0A1U7I417_9CYAN|nr:hypothetical protein [Phormidium ambiguum]OKH30909.1 hypothetical protein NIES2119_30005 [Phormidium ambiguum IAM M-71]